MTRGWLRFSSSLGFVLLSACLSHAGEDWTSDPVPAPGPSTISLVLLGDAGAPTQEAEDTAARVTSVLQQQRAAGANPIVLWLGNNTHSGKRRSPCPGSGERDGPQSPRLRNAVAEHVAAGGASFAVPGPVEHACGLASVASSEAAPFSRPAPQYVVAVDPQGEPHVRLQCTAGGCQEAPLETTAVVELVMIDPTPWTEHLRDAAPTLAALDQLLESLSHESREARPPRVLVSHFPVEAAGEHGMAGYDADSTIHTLYPPLRDAVLAGMFDGVVAAHDHATYAHPDLTDAIKRSDKMWAEAPVWQVVTGAASMPVNGSARPAPKTRYYTSSAYVPEVYTPRTGFAVLELQRGQVTATLHAKARRWSTTRLRMPLRRPPHSSETASPTMAPCLRCPEVPASERQ